MPSTNEATNQLSWMGRVNILYGVTGVVLLAQLGVNGSWRSFLVGWLIAVVNLELLKRIGVMLLALYETETKLPALFYVLLFSKFALWALILAAFSTVKWLQGISFLLGISTLLVSAVGLGAKELVYARRT